MYPLNRTSILSAFSSRTCVPGRPKPHGRTSCVPAHAALLLRWPVYSPRSLYFNKAARSSELRERCVLLSGCFNNQRRRTWRWWHRPFSSLSCARTTTFPCECPGLHDHGDHSRCLVWDWTRNRRRLHVILPAPPSVPFPSPSSGATQVLGDNVSA